MKRMYMVTAEVKPMVSDEVKTKKMHMVSVVVAMVSNMLVVKK